MRQLVQYQDGRLEIQDLPKPTPPPGGFVVRLTHSVISPGTEKMKVEQARMNLLQKARARPDQVRQVVDTARTLGWRNALEKVRNRLESPSPLGYSAAGVVVAVDDETGRFRVGDRLAVGGAECAFHAEYVAIPEHLAAQIPEGVESWEGAYTTLASIAMHAVRQADLRLGETVLVVGQGLIGLLVTSILRAAGIQVLVTDLADDRLELSLSLGASVVPVGGDLKSSVGAISGGRGVDAVMLCIGGSCDELVRELVDVLRDRGTLVVVGMADIELQWKQVYMKEIEVRYARSYGPGRYDTSYEWQGKDYPVGYVRWTEQRNLEACLQLMKDGRLPLSSLTTQRVPFVNAVEAYESLMASDNRDLGVLFEYDASEETPSTEESTTREPLASFEKGRLMSSAPVTRLSVVGAGNFARTMLLPHVQGKMDFGVVVNRTGMSARHVQTKFGFQSASTDTAEVFSNEGKDAVLIGTRHSEHAAMVISALEAKRHVFVEKPLCLSVDELESIDLLVEQSEGSVMVGFNRRFAPATASIKSTLDKKVGPKSIAYQVFAGPLKPDHWYANIAESGGRVIGECCHFFDLFGYLLNERAVRVFAQPIGDLSNACGLDSISAQVEFDGGSTAQLIYSAAGDFRYPKEVMTVYADGVVAKCENFSNLEIYEGRKRRRYSFRSKGHAEEMDAWMRFLKGEEEHPLAYEASRASTALTFAAVESVQRSRSVKLT